MRRIYLSVSAEGEELAVATNLLNPDRYPAAESLTVYQRRWRVERMFGKVTEVFHLERLIGSTARATVFQAAFYFLLSSMMEVMRLILQKEPARRSRRSAWNCCFTTCIGNWWRGTGC